MSVAVRHFAFGALLTGASVLAIANPAIATSIPLLDLPPNVRTVTLGVSDLTAHGSFDWSLGGIAEGWNVGLTGGFDYADPYRRDTNTMVAVRAARRMGGTWPFTWGFVFSGGANWVDSRAVLPDPTSQRFTSDFLPWFQPAVAFSNTVENDKVWVRGTFGPVIGRLTSGAYLMPWLVPNFEAAYRFNPAWEIVVGGGYASPYGVALRAAF